MKRIALALLVTVALAGCASPAASSNAHAQIISKVSSECKVSEKEAKQIYTFAHSLVQAFGKPPTALDLEEILSEVCAERAKMESSYSRPMYVAPIAGEYIIRGEPALVAPTQQQVSRQRTCALQRSLDWQKAANSPTQAADDQLTEKRYRRCLGNK